jgi:hypothetical protein
MVEANRKHYNYLFVLHYWKAALRNPGHAMANLLAIVRYPKLYWRICRRVEGLVSHAIGILLYESVLEVNSTSPNIVEAGAYKGLSTTYLSLAAAKTGKKVISFELFSGLPVSDPILDSGFAKGEFSSEIEEFEGNLRAFGRRDVVKLVVGDAREKLLPMLRDEGFCVAFLDVDVYEVTKELLSQFWTLAKGNEIIIVHDINSPGVRKAVDEFHILSGKVVTETVLFSGTTARLKIPAVISQKYINAGVFKVLE